MMLFLLISFATTVTAAPVESREWPPVSADLQAVEGRRSTHFHVFTEGAPPSQRLERDVIQVLERWHRRYLVAFESKPEGLIPVVLHPQQDFHERTGAPHWADGVYGTDGVIHAAIGGVARVEDGLERLLAHELAHAFISHLSAGQAPRWLQEGLAQNLSARRHAALQSAPFAQSPDELDYASCQDFVAYLIQEHGRAPVRDALAEMGSGNTVATAFRFHLGADPRELLHAWTRHHHRREESSSPVRPRS